MNGGPKRAAIYERGGVAIYKQIFNISEERMTKFKITKKVQMGISSVALLIVIFHMVWPSAAIDSVTVALLIIAIFPWLAPLFRSIEFPGGKVEFYTELTEAEKKVEQSGLIGAKVKLAADFVAADFDTKKLYSFQSVAEEDPQLALAGLRIEIEKRLRAMAEKLHFHTNKKSIGIRELLMMLYERDIISSGEREALSGLVDVLNKAVHSEGVDERSAQWALYVGPKILEGLGRLNKIP
jgi:hypothetical protein